MHSVHVDWPSTYQQQPSGVTSTRVVVVSASICSIVWCNIGMLELELAGVSSCLVLEGAAICRGKLHTFPSHVRIGSTDSFGWVVRCTLAPCLAMHHTTNTLNGRLRSCLAAMSRFRSFMSWIMRCRKGRAPGKNCRGELELADECLETGQ